MLKLMIVDDELLMRIGIRSLIDWEAYGFTLAAESINGKEALEIAEKVKPDLIITDIRMPIMDGLQLIREASKLIRDCQFVILSNFDEFGYVKEALQLGAADYLIKSEVTPAILANLLKKVKEKRLSTNSSQLQPAQTNTETQSLSFLKESFFKDLISGLLTEHEAATKMKKYRIAIHTRPFIVIKLRIDHFAALRKKYVEKDERLLRFSIVNIMEEVIPKRWHKEVVIETSSEYLIIANELDELDMRSEIVKLCNQVQQTLKDFMNITTTIGVSNVQPKLLYMKRAYQEADISVRSSFFKGSGKILFAEDMLPEIEGLTAEDSEAVDGFLYELTQAKKQALCEAYDSQNETLIDSTFEHFREELLKRRLKEKSIREAYFRLTEHISSIFSSRLQIVAPLPYALLLGAENWEELHEIALGYAQKGITAVRTPMDERNYIETAIKMINQYYAENISLQSVASEINVNPSYLSRLFKQEMGENFISYLTRIRIEKAKLYLGNRNYKIYEVADKVGYHNYTYFSKIFKKIVGISPEEYKCGNKNEILITEKREK